MANWVATVHHGLPRKLFAPTRQAGDYLAFLGITKLDPKRYKIVALDNSDIREQINDLENKKLDGR